MQVEFTPYNGMLDTSLGLAVCVLGMLALLGLACSVPAEVTTEEAREHALNRSIMCPVCPGESIDQSQNDLAVSMRQIVREQIGNGKSDQEIKEYFAERYGQVVLLEPPTHGKGLLAWVVPPIGLMLAVLILIFALILMRRRQGDDMDEYLDKKALSQEDRWRYMDLVKRHQHLKDRDLPCDNNSE